MGAENTPSLRVLLADGYEPLLRAVTEAIERLGHQIVAVESDLERVGPVTASVAPDVALVIVGDSSEDALRLIEQIAAEAACPVIAVLDVEDSAFIDRAARLGIFAHIAGTRELRALQSSIEISLRRFAEYHALEGAFGRRAITERAKGILMERHSIDEEQAFNMLRDHARRTQRKLVDVAEFVVGGHPLLPARGDEEAAAHQRSPEDPA